MQHRGHRFYFGKVAVIVRTPVTSQRLGATISRTSAVECVSGERRSDVVFTRVYE